MNFKKYLHSLLIATILLSGCSTTPHFSEHHSQEPPSTPPVVLTLAVEKESAPVLTPVSSTIKSNTPTDLPKDSFFEVHFIDVGQADSTLILCDGDAMLIDGGNTTDSSLLFTYLKKNSVNHLKYVIGTHAHEDHIGGLAGALSYASVEKAYCPTTNYDTKAFRNFVKALDKQNVSITVPKAGEIFSLGSAECTILAVNTKTDNMECNNTSIVLRVTYGETSILFAADAEREVEQVILNSGIDIASTVLKVGHHGSDSSSSYVWLREIHPQYATISVGSDNSYGHPTEEVLSRLRDAEVTTFRTDLQGDIICTSDGKEMTFSVARNKDADVFSGIGNNSVQRATEEPKTTEASPGMDYVANKNTHKFHYLNCSSVSQIKSNNRWDFHGTRTELINNGYVPCKKCNP